MMHRNNWRWIMKRCNRMKGRRQKRRETGEDEKGNITQ
jgi:hypothetical protein